MLAVNVEQHPVVWGDVVRVILGAQYRLPPFGKIVCHNACPGDFGCQAMESWGHVEVFSWDTARTMRMAFTGVFVTTPMSYAWNLCAERVAPGASWSAVVKKLAVQVVAMPPMVRARTALKTCFNGC